MDDVVQNGIIVAAVVFAILLLFRRRSPPGLDLTAGGLYSTDNGDGTYGVVKVLAEDPATVHLRLYPNRFKSRPVTLDPATLTRGSRDEEADGFSIGHLPLARGEFLGWHPVLISAEPVSEEELEGYQIWKEAGGGVFGGRE